MFDKKLYVEACSTLHASEDTLAEVLRITEQRPRKARSSAKINCRFARFPRLVPRPAVLLSVVLVLALSTAALAAGSRFLYSGRVHDASLRDVEKMGFHYPEQLGEYRLLKNSPARIHVAPPETNPLIAWMNPDYIWMSLEYANEMSQSLTVCFGKTDDPLWAYCFDYDEETGIWLGVNHSEELARSSADGSSSYIENITEYEYEGRIIYLADRVTEASSEKDASAGERIDAPTGERNNAPAGERNNASAGERNDAPTGERNNAPAGERNNASAGERNNASAGDADMRNPAPDRRITTEAHWTDPEIGLSFSISSTIDWEWEKNGDSAGGERSTTQEEMLKYAKAVIDGSF